MFDLQKHETCEKNPIETLESCSLGQLMEFHHCLSYKVHTVLPAQNFTKFKKLDLTALPNKNALDGNNNYLLSASKFSSSFDLTDAFLTMSSGIAASFATFRP